MIIFRAVNIYSGQIDHLLPGIENIGSEFQIILKRREDGKDYMNLKVERDEELMARVSSEIKKQIMVSVDVEIVDYGSLPRSERKSKRVFDNRDQPFFSPLMQTGSRS